MRYPASEKLEIIRLVEQSHLPACRTLRQLGVPPATFYRWVDRYQRGGPDARHERAWRGRERDSSSPVRHKPIWRLDLLVAPVSAPHPGNSRSS